MGTCHSCDSMRATTAHDTSGPPMPGPCEGGGHGQRHGAGGEVERLGRGVPAWQRRRTLEVSSKPCHAAAPWMPVSGGFAAAWAAGPTYLGKGDEADLAGSDARLRQRLLHQLHRPLLVMQRGLPWKETLAGRRDEPAQGVQGKGTASDVLSRPR
jgi:hypothetical protein